MWNLASNAISGTIGLRNDSSKASRASSDCSDDEVSSNTSREEGLECPICWESFNIVENVPYVLWCGHTLCKNCVLGLQWAVVKFPALPVQLPLFISCPWCHLLSFRLVYKGNLKFPRKNFFLLWMVESMNGDRVKSHSSFFGEHQPAWSSTCNSTTGGQVNYSNPRRTPRGHHLEHSGSSHDNASVRANYLNLETLNASLLPSFLILYFAYPSLDWLVREIIT
ncbi:hypothetical protein AQUCO_00200765v1 [Aquilegia coerulea]|uniref:RING-type domain-containing protein n=1 Tax=Aquilegia coerulea TaxID=218851 RepID=A0A2G5F4L6_AQUCA|nr:hypothetical protein AQUCO_00200765v1 [Aquilegia coerulea]